MMPVMIIILVVVATYFCSSMGLNSMLTEHFKPHLDFGGSMFAWGMWGFPKLGVPFWESL